MNVKFNPSGIEPNPDWWVIYDHGRYAVPEGFILIDVIGAVGKWIKSQPTTEWKYLDGEFDITRYAVSEELYTLMLLRWIK